ncbi:LSU ribosomal protein L16p (L10e) [Olavius algarvensis spirochete endosymbiont]|uniref:50S ribosomal protein L16 n=1 Tax=Olavius algarvensis spirochete endosymbiont TaxID=260710 RepID=UPI000F1C65F6|nr:50S ribosomal protein L16 [Olavius algarvensis spirochete endosymbiont]VDB01097.1 LSU ribosomal protein L16p (L10e) [Olavius algarvensis spirochete endosymbiont]
MLSPKRTKYRKTHRGRAIPNAKRAQRGNEVSFGDYGLISMENMQISARQIEAARVAMTRHIKRGGKVWIRIFPNIPYTKKPAETRMGKGKGSPEKWLAAVKPGTVMFEIAGVDVNLAERAVELAGSKLPVKTKFVVRHHAGWD